MPVLPMLADTRCRFSAIAAAYFVTLMLLLLMMPPLMFFAAADTFTIAITLIYRRLRPSRCLLSLRQQILPFFIKMPRLSLIRLLTHTLRYAVFA